MIKIEEAIAIARKHDPKYDTYVEYRDGYVFIEHGKEDEDDAAMVVLKSSGELISMAIFDYDYIIPHRDFGQKKRIRF